MVWIIFWCEEALHAVWSPSNLKKQNQYKDCLIQKIKESDVFIFQDITGHNIIDELKTDYLHDNVCKGVNISIPNSRLFVNMIDISSLEPYIKYALTIYPDDYDKAIKYLEVSDDPELTNLLDLEFPITQTHVPYRNENNNRYKEDLVKYDIVINMNDFIEQEYDKQILFETNNHPSRPYFVELIRRLYKHLNISEEEHPIANFLYPGGHSEGKFDPRQFKFLRDYFTDMDYTDFTGRFVTVENIQDLN